MYIDVWMCRDLFIHSVYLITMPPCALAKVGRFTASVRDCTTSWDWGTHSTTEMKIT